MIAIVHSIYSQSVHVLALNVGLMDNDAERSGVVGNFLLWERSHGIMVTYMYPIVIRRGGGCTRINGHL